MSNITKKIDRLSGLKNSVRESIYNACNNEYYDQNQIDNEAEIIHRNEVVGLVKYKVSVNVLDYGDAWGYDHPPTADEIEFILESAAVEMVYSSSDKELPIVTKALNEALKASECKTLKF